MTLDRNAKRGVLFLILHALMWVFAIFAVDGIWGDRAAQWTAIVFTLVNGAAAAWFGLHVMKFDRRKL